MRWLAPPRRLLAAALVMDLGMAAASLAVQNLGVRVLDAPNFALGLFGTVFSSIYTLGCFFVSGHLSDRFGRRRCVVAGAVGCAVAWLLLPGARDWSDVLWAMALQGLSLSLFWPSVLAWLAELSTDDPRELAGNLGRFNLMWCSGAMIGPVLSGYLWELDYPLAFMVPAGLVFLLAPMALLTRRGERHAEPPEPEEGEDRRRGPLFLTLARVGLFASSLGGAATGAMFPKLAHSLGMSAATLGWILFAAPCGYMLVFLLGHALGRRWHYRLWPLVMVEALAAGGMGLVVLTTRPALFALGFLLFGTCGGLMYSSSLFYSLHTAGTSRGRTSAVHEAVGGLGLVFGPLLAGLSAQFVDLRAPYVVAALVVAAALGAQLVLWRAARPAPLSVPAATPGGAT